MQSTLSPNKSVKDETRGIEKFSFASYFFGQGLIYAFAGGTYLMMYMTDFVKLDPFVVAALLAVCKIWDAVNDTLFGMLIDRTRFKSGKKFIPWLFIACIAVPICTVFLFAANDTMPMWLRIVWVIVGYIIWDSAYTLSDAPAFALVTGLTDNVKERIKLTTFGNMGGVLAAGIFTLVFVSVFENFGFLVTSAIIAPISLITMMLITVFGKERVKQASINIPENKSASFKDTFRYLGKNKYLLFFYLYRFVSGSLYIAFTPYITKHWFGDIKYVSYIMLVSIPLILLVYVFSGKISKRFDKIVIYRFCMMLSMGLQVFMLIAAKNNVWIYVIGSALTLAVNILPTIFMTAIPGDCVEYGTYKSGARKEGITFALQTFTAKITSSIALSLGALLLGFINYSGEAAVQPEAVKESLWFWGMLVPVVSQAISIPLLFLYKLRDKDAQLMADCNMGKITREECEESLSSKY